MAPFTGTAPVKAVFEAIRSQCMQLGVFELVLTHEPKSAPQAGLTLAIWWDSMEAVPAASGLAAVSVRVVFRGRVYKSFLAKPEDDIDPSLLGAACSALNAFSNAFSLSGLVRDVDLLGAHGNPLMVRSAYVDVDGKIMRLADIEVAVIINDAWSENA